MSLFLLSTLQKEHKPWADKNFGERPAWMPYVGMVEELGELDEAINEFLYGSLEKRKTLQLNIEDGLGDVVIFMADFANAMNFDLDYIVDNLSINVFFSNNTPINLIGQLAHSFLKYSQNIRGTKEQHISDMKVILGRIIDYLRFTAHYRCKKELIVIVEETWEKVKQRDWSKNPMTGESQ